jgi:copper chaperone CopZ
MISEEHSQLVMKALMSVQGVLAVAVNVAKQRALVLADKSCSEEALLNALQMIDFSGTVPGRNDETVTFVPSEGWFKAA